MKVIYLTDGQQDEVGDAGEQQSIYDNAEANLAETFEVIDPRCRPRPVFCTSAEEVERHVGDSATIVPFVPSDPFAHLPHHTDPDLHYEILSKRHLVLSGLPTPESQLIDFNCPPNGIWSETLLDEAVTRALHVVQQRSLPFVLKLNSAMGSKGTFFVRNSSDLSSISVQLKTFLRHDLETFLTTSNAHLHPCSLILTKLLPGPEANLGFYVRKDGTAKFVCCCVDDFSQDGHHFLGGSITYSRQDELKTRYQALLQRTAAYLHTRGYYGPAGIDVMADESGRDLIVDLNPRLTTTAVLGCLRTHFTRTDLRVNEAYIGPVLTFQGTRSDFKVAFEHELQNGLIVVLVFCEDRRRKLSYTHLVVGGSDATDMKNRYAHIQEWAQRRTVTST